MSGLGAVVPLLALAALLGTAYRHPPPLVETLVAVLAGAAVLLVGLPGRDALDAVRELAPVVAFLVTILVVSEVCDRAGLFAWAARAVGRVARGRPDRLLLGVVALATLVTVVLSLDATVVLLTPVVVVAALGARTSPRPGAYACLRLANSGSLLLPVSNLTNLLAVPHLHLSFAGFALRMAPVLVAVVATEYVAMRWLFRRELTAPAAVPEAVAPVPLRAFPLVVVALMLVGFGVGSAVGVQPWVASTAAAVVLTGWAVRERLVGLRTIVVTAQPSFAVFVLGLGVVVAGASLGPLGDAVDALLPGGTGPPSYVDLLVVAGVATLAANLVTNLSATLLVVPVVAPLGSTAVLAALLGLNIGAGLTYPGSLANLLWRRGLLARGDGEWGLAGFHRVSLVITPVCLLVAVSVLSLWAAILRT